MTPIAIWSPSARTVTIVTREAVVALPASRILAVADWFDWLHDLMAGKGTISISSAEGHWLRLATADLADLAAGIRDAVATPAHARALIAASTT